MCGIQLGNHVAPSLLELNGRYSKDKIIRQGDRVYSMVLIDIFEGAYRKSAEELDLPKIPAQPIGYGDAKRLLTVMGGDAAPDSWQGKISNVTYRLGGSMNGQHEGWKVNLVVNNFMKDKESSNVIGVIKGEEEPDRYPTQPVSRR